MRVAFTTFGCKINQYETDLMGRTLAASGNAVVPFDDEADVYVINTCSVTAKSDYQCRQAIRSAVKRGQGARIVVTGCYAETRPEELRNIPGVDAVIGNSGKEKLADYLLKSTGLPSAEASRSQGQATAVRSRTRGFLKIQDGCDNQCSYCIVPFARGRSRSVLP
ncbi:MAG: tRNA (N(6)-L-threonylcarbamoyladenosine(37)-C(2))-methylthiotransferase MtaB, partial [Nitrospirota bacterium]